MSERFTAERCLEVVEQFREQLVVEGAMISEALKTATTLLVFILLSDPVIAAMPVEQVAEAVVANLIELHGCFKSAGAGRDGKNAVGGLH